MPVYAIAMIPLIHHLDVTQFGYADNVLVLVAGYLVCVSGGTSCANLDWALAIFPMLPKLS